MDKPVLFKVIKELCLGCGMCVQSCPRGAVTLNDYAEIDQTRCNGCGICADNCARGAIVRDITISKEELVEFVADLKARTDDVLRRIEALKG